jgi:predicted nuclease with TOPRIM domain
LVLGWYIVGYCLYDHNIGVFRVFVNSGLAAKHACTECCHKIKAPEHLRAYMMKKKKKDAIINLGAKIMTKTLMRRRFGGGKIPSWAQLRAMFRETDKKFQETREESREEMKETRKEMEERREESRKEMEKSRKEYGGNTRTV